MEAPPVSRSTRGRAVRPPHPHHLASSDCFRRLSLARARPGPPRAARRLSRCSPLSQCSAVPPSTPHAPTKGGRRQATQRAGRADATSFRQASGPHSHHSSDRACSTDRPRHKGRVGAEASGRRRWARCPRQLPASPAGSGVCRNRSPRRRILRCERSSSVQSDTARRRLCARRRLARHARRTEPKGAPLPSRRSSARRSGVRPQKRRCPPQPAASRVHNRRLESRRRRWSRARRGGPGSTRDRGSPLEIPRAAGQAG